jgi:hypothetical protein
MGRNCSNLKEIEPGKPGGAQKIEFRMTFFILLFGQPGSNMNRNVAE